MADFFRSQQSPRGESQMNISGFVSPPRTGPTLPRRFTADSGRVPTLSSITNMHRGAESKDPIVTEYKVQLLEKKKLEYERLREQKRRFEAEMHKLDQQQRDEEQELARLANDLGRFGPGHQSEPTTPPEYRDRASGFPGLFSRPNRYSTSNVTSPPPGLFNRPGRSGSQLASPPSGLMQSRFAFDDLLPARSVPGSRRNSDDDDEKEEAVRQDPTSHRSTNALNRYSMPVTRSRSYITELNIDSSLDSNNTTGFLFGDEDSGANEVKSYQQANHPDVFPSYRNGGYSNMLSNPSSTLDSVQSQSSAVENSATNGWGSIHRHRAQQSLTNLGSAQLTNKSMIASGPSSDVSTIGTRTPRHSIDLKGYQVASPGSSEMSGASTTVPASASNHGSNIMATPPKLQQSYSSNEVPTVKSNNGASAMSPNANNHAQQHFHNHNLSTGRFPGGAPPTNRHSREMSSDNSNMSASREGTSYGSINSTLHASAAPFGPAASQGNQPAAMNGTAAASFAPNPYTQQYYNAQANFNASPNGASYNGAQNGMGANMNYPQLAMGMQGLNISGNGGQPMYQPPQGYQGYNNVYQPQVGRAAPHDSQARVIQSRRAQDNEVMNRFNNLDLASCTGKIYDLCKDQHGCRFLQKQLETRAPDAIYQVWLETNQHVTELMVDPFGNYLCQKLLEYCNDEQRTTLIQNAAHDMIRIALNQHGTRALQKMIEYVSTPQQVNIIVDALRHRVVDLIQDLNGNHVIQKCLNKLSPAEAQFIFDAVGNHCVEVGTHRHGCCVLQRCIDHASGVQKSWLIQKITESAVRLVQDPFGNYVVQYIIDLADPSYTEPLVVQFRGRIGELSRQKFSSNVIEKCLRCSNDASKDLIVEELVVPGEMDRLLRDQFANYVVQTALDFATPYMKHRLVEVIRPLLPGVRSTPYGRRIQAKVTQYDNHNGTGPNGQVGTGPNSALNSALNSGVNSNLTSGQVTPVDGSQAQVTSRPSGPRFVVNSNPVGGTSPHVNGVNGANDVNGANGVNGVNGGSADGSIGGNASTVTDANGNNGVLSPTRSAMVHHNGNGPAVPPPQPQRVQQFAPRQFQNNGPNATEGEQHWV